MPGLRSVLVCVYAISHHCDELSQFTVQYNIIILYGLWYCCKESKTALAGVGPILSFLNFIYFSKSFKVNSEAVCALSLDVRRENINNKTSKEPKLWSSEFYLFLFRRDECEDCIKQPTASKK